MKFQWQWIMFVFIFASVLLLIVILGYIALGLIENLAPASLILGETDIPALINPHS